MANNNKVKPGEKRLHIDGLMPDTKYAVQVRAVDNGVDSKWSQKYHIETIDDTMGGSRNPPKPQLTSFDCNSGQFVAVWNTIGTYDDGVSVMVVNSYEIELTGAFGTIITPHYGTATETQSRHWSFAVLKSLFGGNLPTSLTARLRVLSSARTPSEWSEPLTATLPVPNPPTNPAAAGVVDGIKVTWEPPTDPIHLFGYRVYVGIGDENAGFIPGPMSLCYQGGALETTYTSLTYDKMHYFKIVSYSEAGLESTWVEASAKPVSPYGPDTTPPTPPVLAAPTMDRSTVTAPMARMAWTHDDTVEPNKDTAGFVVRWRMDGEDRWRNAYFDKAARDGVIDLPQPFANYEFEISAYDFVANYSDYAGTTQTLTGAGDAPGVVTGLDSVARWDGLRIFWDESTESVKYGGEYHVQYNTTGTFANDTPDYVTAATSIDIAGLTSLTEYFYRVRAVDSAGQEGPWTSTASKTLPAFPAANATDGEAPTDAPTNVRATGGLNYVNIAWDRVTNSDAVWYEVFMSTTSTFTEGPSTFVGESSGTSLMVASDNAGNALQQDTVYHFKVRAVDGDAPGPVSSNVSATLTQVLSTDLGIDMGGENLLFNSSLDVDSDGNGVADYWSVYNNSSQTEPHVASLVTGRTGGFAQRVSWTGANTTTKGIYCVNSPVTRGGTEYTVSFYGRANGGTGFGLRFNQAIVGSVVDIDNPSISSSWQRYIFKFRTTATPDPANFFITIEDHVGSTGWLEIDDVQLEAGNTASAYKTGTTSIAKLVTGKFQSADMVISTGGRIVSQTYLNNPNTGFLITDTGITLKDGQVDAKTLVANSTITNNLYVGSVLEMAAGGIIESSNYNPGVAGYRLSSVSLDIRTGTVAAGVLAAGIITSPDIKIGTNGKITVDSTGSIQSNNYSYTPAAGSIPESGTGWRIASTGIQMWDTNSKINVNALISSTLETTAITIGSGGEIKSSSWDGGTGARWLLNENTFTMYNGTITGTSIYTNALTSLNQVPAPGGSRPAFSINIGGYTEVTGIRIYGNALVGNDAANVLQSGNYDGNVGWKLQGNGVGNFHQINTWGLRVNADAVVSSGAGNVLRSESFSYNSGGNGGTGWIIRGDGYAEFNAGMLAVGNAGGGKVMMTLDAAGTNAMLRFYQPGNTTSFGNIRQRTDNVLEMRGGWGGAITFNPAWYTGRTLVQIAQDLDVTGLARINNGITVEGGGINIQSGGLGLNGGVNVRNGGIDISGADFVSRTNNNHMTNVSSPNGGPKREMLIDGSLIVGGQQRGSSIRIKDEVRDYEYSKKQILSLRPVRYKLKDHLWDDAQAHGVNSFSGVIAEEALDAGLDDFVILDAEGEVEDFDYPRFTSALLHVAREQQKEIDELKKSVEKLLRKS